jgi:hypothetical protein
LATIDEAEEHTHHYSSGNFGNFTLETFESGEKKKRVQIFKAKPTGIVGDIKESSGIQEQKEFELVEAFNLENDPATLILSETKLSNIMPLIKGFKSILQAKSSSFLIKQENSGENKVYDLCQLSEEQEQSDDLTSKCQLAVKERILFDMKSNLNSGHSTGDL